VQHSQSPITAEGSAVMGAVNPFMSGSRLIQKGPLHFFKRDRLPAPTIASHAQSRHQGQRNRTKAKAHGRSNLCASKQDQLAFFDRLAVLTHALDASFNELRGLYEADERQRVPAMVYNAVVQRTEPI
jgi:hypothetical protein